MSRLFDVWLGLVYVFTSKIIEIYKTNDKGKEENMLTAVFEIQNEKKKQRTVKYKDKNKKLDIHLLLFS